MKIEIKEVSVKNFLSYGKVKQTFNLEDGITIIQGKNGQGKSSLMEAIYFSLFNKTSDDVKKDDIINWKNKKKCEVSIKFDIGNDKYEVVRTIKPDSFKIYKNESLIDPLSNVKDYQKFLENEILKMDYKTFSSTIYCNINNYKSLFDMSKQEKRNFLEKVFNLDFSIFTNNIQEKIKPCNKKIDKIDNDISLKESLKIHKENEQKNLIGIKKRIKDEIVDLDKQLNKIEVKDTSDIKQEYDRLLKELSDINEKISSIKISITADKTNLDNYKKNKSSIEKDIENTKIKNKKYKEKMNELSELKKTDWSSLLLDKENELERTNKESKEHENNYNEIKKELDIVNHNIKRLEKNLNIFTTKKICPTCGTKASEESINNHKKELNNEKRNKNILSNKLKTQNDKCNSLSSKELKIESDIRKIKDNIQKINEYSNIKEMLNENVDRTSEISELKEEINQLIFTINWNEKELKNINKDKKELENNIENVKKEIKKNDEIIDGKKKIETELLLKKREIKQVKNNIDSITEIVKEYSKEIDSLKENLDKLSNILEHFNYLKTIFKDEHLKKFAISNIIPLLNKKVNEYLSMTSHPFFVQIDNWMDIVVKGPGIYNAKYKNLSSGEKRVIDLALQLSLIDIMKIRTGTNFDILLLDEILDSSVDTFNMDVIYSIIEEKMKIDNLKVCIITHRDDVDVISNNIIKIVKKDGYSILEKK